MKQRLLVTSLIAALSTPALAFEFETSDDWSIRWDNTFKGNLMFRTAAQDKDVYVGRAGNESFFIADDADLSVDRSNLGLISSRIDVFTEMDVIYKDNFGFRVSASAWYDPAYKDSDHPSDRRYTWASPSVDPGEYTDEALALHYKGGELLDAFVFANFDIGETALGIRAGRHTIYWGNSLLAGGAISGVGGSMAPLDFSKAFSVPGTDAKELFLPTTKISTVYQLTDNLTLNAYYGFEHRRHRLPESGTFFSPAEGLTEDTEFITIPAGEPGAANRNGFTTYDDEVEDNEWGVNLQYYVESLNLETSFIYLNYVDKNLHGLHSGFDVGQLGAVISESGSDLAPLANILLSQLNALCASDPAVACPNAPVVDAAAGTTVYGSGRWLFKDDIDMYALSLSKEIAGISMGLDLVYRVNTGLAPSLSNSLQRFYNSPDAFTETIETALGLEAIPGDYFSYDSSNYLAPVGDTISLVVNGVGFLSDNGWWEGGSYIMEATFSVLDDCTENCQLLDTSVEEGRIVSSVAGVFKPTWFQVLPGWDMSVPLSVSYTIHGKSPFTFGGDEGRGNGSVGVEFNINELWNFQAKYNVFFGPVSAGIGGLLKDRDNVALTLKYTL
ncbi:MAG: hypothetical protein ACI9B9_001950 [Halioglobus sp.]|jgi:hypothetical protein